MVSARASASVDFTGAAQPPCGPFEVVQVLRVPAAVTRVTAPNRRVRSIRLRGSTAVPARTAGEVLAQVAQVERTLGIAEERHIFDIGWNRIVRVRGARQLLG